MRRRENHRAFLIFMALCLAAVVATAVWFVPYANNRMDRCKAAYGTGTGYSLIKATCTIDRPLP